MKKRNLKATLSLGKNIVSNLVSNQVKGGLRTDICSGLQETCGGCDGVTRNPCVKPSRGWCPQN